MNLLVLLIIIGAAIAARPFINHLRLRARYRPRTADLYSEHINAIQHEEIPHPDTFFKDHMRDLLRRVRPRVPCNRVLYQVGCAIDDLFKQETEIRPVVPSQNVLIADGIDRDYVLGSLNRSKNFALNLPAFERALHGVWQAYFKNLPHDAFDEDIEKPFTHIDLLEAIPDVGVAVCDVAAPLIRKENRDRSLFDEFNHTWERNAFAASGQTYPYATRDLIAPHQFKGTRAEIVDAYLRDTALWHLFQARIPFSFTDMLKEHGLLLAPPGWGKSQIIQSLTYHLAQQSDPPTIIILNSQGSMLDRIQRLAVFAPGEPLSDRLVIIDPEDDLPPALNMFSMPTERMKSYSRNDREQIEAGTIETFEYLFSSVASDLTSKQTTAFQYLISLVLSIPGGNFNTFAELLQETTKDPSGKDSKYAPRHREARSHGARILP
jgi:hypothetical protein